VRVLSRRVEPITRLAYPHEPIYFKVYKSRIPVIEQAPETAALMLGTDKSRAYCLDMIGADFLGANLANQNLNILFSTRFFNPKQDRVTFFERVRKAC